MNEDYDVILLGTGLKECILSGLLSVKGFKVLHMDRNDYYGGESASLNLNQLYRKFKNNEEPDENKLGKSKYYCADLCPKFIMACGDLVKMLLHTKVTRYLDFKSIAGSFVYKDDTVHKVPATGGEALATSLMGFMQKRRFKNFLQMVQQYEQSNPATHKGKDASRTTMQDMFEFWKLDDNTKAFVGHAMALEPNDDYLVEPALSVFEKIQMYAYSVMRYGNSPFIYPVYGLGGLPEGFSRLSAIHGGTYMLNKPIDEILYDESGKVRGVKSEGEDARAPIVIGDPSYFAGTDKVKSNGQVARWLFIMNHPIPNTNNSDSAQVIIPFKHTGRQHDIYISCVSHAHSVAATSKYVAMVSSIVETDNPKQELSFGVRLLGQYEADFFAVSDSFAPTGDGSKDSVYISHSFDASTHFQADTNEVLIMYERIVGSKFDLNISAEPDDLKEM